MKQVWKHFHTYDQGTLLTLEQIRGTQGDIVSCFADWKILNHRE